METNIGKETNIEETNNEETNIGKETNIEEETNFINFGCWNKIDNNPGLFNVVKSIKKEKNIDFFIINGDNYYQKKDKKKKDKSKKEKSDKDKSKKVVVEKDLINGFKLLDLVTKEFENDKHKELYLLLGNHDIELINERCDTTILQKDFVTNNKNYHFPNNLTMFKEIGKTLIIMIDTNIYDNKDPTCYKDIFDDNKIFNDTNLKEMVENKDIPIEVKNIELKKYQYSLIHDFFNTGKKYKNIIVCGHHPIYGIKIKNNSIIEQLLHSDIYNIFFEIKKHAEIFYYLCSDIHNYQEGKVTINNTMEVTINNTMEINQYIVGTGGTDLDIINNSVLDEYDYKTDNFELKYKMNNYLCKYGYIVVNIKDDIITVTPKMINIHNISKKKSKYNKNSYSSHNRKSRNSRYSKKIKSM
jgi:hypothetical protein